MPESTAQLLVVLLVALVVVGFVVWPIVVRRRDAGRHPAVAVDADRVEARIADYRRALRQRTICERCLYANPEDSRYCAECGARLPAAGSASDAGDPAA